MLNWEHTEFAWSAPNSTSDFELHFGVREVLSELESILKGEQDMPATESQSDKPLAVRKLVSGIDKSLKSRPEYPNPRDARRLTDRRRDQARRELGGKPHREVESARTLSVSPLGFVLSLSFDERDEAAKFSSGIEQFKQAGGGYLFEGTKLANLVIKGTRTTLDVMVDVAEEAVSVVRRLLRTFGITSRSQGRMAGYATSESALRRILSGKSVREALEETVIEPSQNPLDFKTNATARSIVRKILANVDLNHVFSDEYWQGPKLVWNALTEAKLDWNMTGSSYKKNDQGIDSSKQWKFEIRFVNDNKRPTVLHGTLTASGAGSVQDPLEKYDVVVTVD